MTDVPPVSPEPTPASGQPAPSAYTQPTESPYTTPYAAAAPTKTPILSILSMIGGILGVLSGFFGWGLLFAIAAVVLGFLGRKREPAARGFWLTGLITGFVGIAINVIVIGFFVVLFIIGLSAGSYDY